MMYAIGLFVGLLNGLFASGAGQILVFYFVFIKKYETHQMRAVSVAILSISSIFALIGYHTFVSFDWVKVGVLAVIAAITGWLGAKLMKKIPSPILNLISGILITGLTIYKLIAGGN